MNEVPLPKLAFTLDETAQVLNVSRATISRLVRQGALRVSDLGHRTVRVSEDSIKDMLRHYERTATKAKTGRRFVQREEAKERR